MASDAAIPSPVLAAGTEAMAPEGPLANTRLDAGMMGMMREQGKDHDQLQAQHPAATQPRRL